MALAEISPNVRRNGSQRSGLQAKGLLSPRAPSSVASRGIQSMLRTTTETGDIGQFSVKPSRLARTASRLAMAPPRSGSFDASLVGPMRLNTKPHQGAAGRRGPTQMRSLTNLSRPDTIRSNLMSHHQDLRSRPLSPRSYQHDIGGGARSSLGSRSLYSHRSFLTMRSQRDYRSMHSNSPRSFATRMRPPGQRAHSPAFSDMPDYGMRRGLLYPQARSLASSPSSVYPIRRRNLGYTSDMNNSYTSFARLPSPAIPLSHAGISSFRPPSRITTPGSLRDHRGASYVSLVSHPQGLPDSPTGSSAPAYYDYSESFIEEDYSSPNEGEQVTASSVGIDQILHEHRPPLTHSHAQTPFGIRSGSIYNPAELPTIHNRTLSEASRPATPVVNPVVVPKRTSSLIPVSLIAKQDVVVGSTRPAEASQVEEPKALSAGSAFVARNDHKPQRTSTVSNASHVSSRSSSFFPNASRSPRDLTSLAARAHYSDADEIQKAVSTRQGHYQKEGLATTVSSTRSKPLTAIPQGWQLPSMDFRPFSLLSSVQSKSDRSRTSASVPARACTAAIISPTPERPMSSQSRKRFSKILDIDDDYAGSDAKVIKKSCSNLDFLRLKNVEDVPESNYPPHFSIPPFSPIKSRTGNAGSAQDKDAALVTPTVAASQAMNLERSTVESLLDHHIEALGLMPEAADDEHTTSAEDVDVHFPSGATDDTFKALAASLHKKKVTRSHSKATVPSYVRGSLGSPERHRLMPRRLFASVNMNETQLQSLQSAPQLTKLVPSKRLPDRPSYGWETLASSSQLNSMSSMPSVFSNEMDRGEQDVGVVKRFKIRRRSALSLSTTSYKGPSQSIEDFSRRNKQVSIHKRPSPKSDRKASHRRQERIRLKMKHNRRSSSSSSAKSKPGRLSDVEAASQDAKKQAHSEDSPIEVEGPAELDSRPVEAIRDNVTSPKIPHRLSSLINVIQQPINRSIDIVKKPSIRTIRSHPSISSLAEPSNSTRLAAQSPHMVSQISVSMLAPPDLGPPLHASTLDLSVPYAPEPSTVQPTIRETRSFFSGDGTRLDQNSMVSSRTGLRRRSFGFHSLRNAIPAVPRASTVQRAFGAKQPGNHLLLHHSCRKTPGAGKPFDEEPESTVGMSDFAYRKRRLVRKVKEWWMRQCVQKRLVATVTRKKSAS